MSMDKESNKKVITVAFVATAVLAALVLRVLLETAAASWGVFARYYAQDWVKHGLPVAVALITFMSLQLNKKVLVWADEVVVEIKKVVWPTRKDTTAMTVVVCIMLLISGVILGAFDFLSGSFVKMIVN
jgi:preprotein translocase subunit SecE